MDKRMTAFLISYTLASLAHFVHNAEFINDYPNMPDWLSSADVFGAWIAVAAIGLAGYLMVRMGFGTLGFIAIALYGAFGLDALAHYAYAPVFAHTLNMNTTIWLEAITGMVLAVNAIS